MRREITKGVKNLRFLTSLVAVLKRTAMKASTGPVLPMMVSGWPENAAYTMPHKAVAAII